MPRSRSPAAEAARLLDRARLPLYLVDESRRIVFCNQACAAWLQQDPAALIGQTCNYHSQGASASQQLAALLCPLPDAFAGQRSRGRLTVPDADGCLRQYAAEFIPLAGESSEATSVLVVIDPREAATEQASQRDEDESLVLHRRLLEWRHRLRRHYHFERLVGVSPVMIRVRTQVALAAQTSACTLIVGPSGSGRQHVARAIHFSQPEPPGPLMPLSCLALSGELLQSTLGALLAPRAAMGGPPGAAAVAEAGTLLLSDMQELGADLQAALAHWLAEDRLRLRLIATATTPLDRLVERGAFHAELACRLSTLVIHLPPLAERPEDIPLLAQALLEELNAAGGKQLRGFSPGALDLMTVYSWPGNIDELAEAVRHAHGQAEGVEIGPAHLPRRLSLAADAARHPRPSDEPIRLPEFLSRVERELIERALRRAKGNKAKAARLLGLTRPRLYRRMEQLGLLDGGPSSEIGTPDP